LHGKHSQLIICHYRAIWFFILHFLGEHIPLSLMMYYQITSSIRYKKIQESSNPLTSVDGRDDDTFFLIMNQQKKKKGGEGMEDDEREHTDLNHSLEEIKEVDSDKSNTPKKGGFSKLKPSATKTPIPESSSLRSSEFGANNNNKESVLSRAYPSLHEN
jgi:hypothetical protein